MTELTRPRRARVFRGFRSPNGWVWRCAEPTHLQIGGTGFRTGVDSWSTAHRQLNDHLRAEHQEQKR